MARKRQEAKSEAAMRKAMEAALGLFSEQGFRGTTMRQVAERSGLSLGNLYHHFPNKEAIFQRLIDVYFERLLDPELPLNKVFHAGKFPEDLEQLADAIEQVVEDNIPFILLIYVDVIEFRGEHIRTFYEDMAARYQEVYGERLAARKERGELGDVDPLAGVMMASRWFFYFFTVEKCFGVPMHLGLEPRQAVKEFVRVLRYGLLPRGEEAEGQPEDEGEESPGRT